MLNWKELLKAILCFNTNHTNSLLLTEQQKEP